MDKIVYPITINARDESNKTIYDISEYVNWNGTTTVNLQAHGDTIGDVAINATKAIHAMEEAIIKRNKENGTTLEDILTEQVNLFNTKEEEADGR